MCDPILRCWAHHGDYRCERVVGHIENGNGDIKHRAQTATGYIEWWSEAKPAEAIPYMIDDPPTARIAMETNGKRG